MMRTYGAVAAYLLRQTKLYLRRGKENKHVTIIGGADGPTAVFTVGRPSPRRHGALQVPPDARALASAFARCAGCLALLWAVCSALSHLVRRKPHR